MKRVSRGERPPQLNQPPLNNEAWKLIHRCWVKEILKRPAMKDIVKRMRAWMAMTPTSTDPQNLASESKGSLSHRRRSRRNHFGTIAKHPTNEILFNGTSSLDGSNSMLTTKLLVGFNSGNASSNPPSPTPIRPSPVPRISSSANNETKMTIAIDFGKRCTYPAQIACLTSNIIGTTFSGVVSHGRQRRYDCSRHTLLRHLVPRLSLRVNFNKYVLKLSERRVQPVDNIVLYDLIVAVDPNLLILRPERSGLSLGT